MDMALADRIFSMPRTRLEDEACRRLREGFDTEAVIWNPDGFVKNFLRAEFDVQYDAFGAQSIHVKRVWLIAVTAGVADIDITRAMSGDDIDTIADDIYERMEWTR